MMYEISFNSMCSQLLTSFVPPFSEGSQKSNTAPSHDPPHSIPSLCKCVLPSAFPSNSSLIDVHVFLNPLHHGLRMRHTIRQQILAITSSTGPKSDARYTYSYSSGCFSILHFRFSSALNLLDARNASFFFLSADSNSICLAGCRGSTLALLTTGYR